MAVLVTAPMRFTVKVSASDFPPFLPKEVEKIRDPPARELAKRIQRLPVNVSFLKNTIMSSCVKALQNNKLKSEPVVLLHGFDSSILEWRYTYPLLQDAGLETWAIDILGWGFSDLETLPPCNVAAKREHLYQFWRSHIQRPMVLVGHSLGAAVAIDFAASHPEAVAKLVLIDASVYAEGTGNFKKLPKAIAYAGVAILKSIPLRIYANSLTFSEISFFTSIDWANRLKEELPNSVLCQIPECGHLPHVEQPKLVADFVSKFLQDGCVPISDNTSSHSQTVASR